MTTEQIVVLFTDVVASTERSIGHSVDEVDETRRAHFSILRQAIAETGGTEIKNTGDGLMVTFGSASAALACGAAMQQRVEADNRRQQQRVGLRIGISGGEATRDEDDYFGDCVVEAARLCATCESGQVLAADVVRLLAGRRSRQQCRSVGALVLKGLPDPVEVVEVVWAPLEIPGGPARIPLPGRLAVVPDFGVVGRAAELRTIADAVDRVATTSRREVLLIAGEAGVGKTTLAAAAARRGFEHGATVLFGRCEEDLVTPYQLFAESLGHFVTHAPEDLLLAHVTEHGSALAALAPMLAGRIPDLPPTRAIDADSERYLLFAAVVALLSDESASRPLILVLDDLQWADRGSLLLLRHLATSEHPMRLLILGTYRDHELATGHPLLDALAALHRQRDVARIDLVGMDDDEVVAFIEAAAGYTLDPPELDLARAVQRETDGNPFFVTEVLRHLAETGAIHRDESGRWVAQGSFEQLGLPDSVREVIGARIGRLGGEANRALAVAAVIGRDFDLDLLSRATGTSEDDLLDILDSAASASLVREQSDRPGRFSFAHVLIQRAVLYDLGPTRTARTHRQVAEALEAMCGDRPGPRIGALARHWFEAQPRDVARAISYAHRAGDAALAGLAPEVALRFYVQAITLVANHGVVDEMLSIDLAIGLGTAQRQTGDPACRETLLDAARRAAAIDDTDRLVTAALANDRGWYSVSGAVDEDKVGLLELALDRLPADHRHRALVLGTLCAELAFSGTLERRQALADQALSIARTTGDDATVARILNHLVFPLLVPSLLDQSLAWSDEALRRAQRVGDPLLIYFAAMYRATVATRAGDMAEVDRCLAIAGPLTQQLDQPSLHWEYTFHLARRAQVAGDTAEAERLATRALEIGTECGQPDAATFFGAQLAVVSWQRGTMGDLAPLLEEMVIANPGLASLQASLAVAYAEGDRLDEARQLLEAFAASGFELPQDSTWLNGMTEYAEAAVACGDPSFAAPLLDLLAPYEHQFSCAGGVTAEGPVSLVLGGLATVLDLSDDADRYFAEAAAFSERVEATYFAARTDLLWGEMLARRGSDGDLTSAGVRLDRARSVSTAQGYVGLERRAAVDLAAMGGPADRRTSGSTDRRKNHGATDEVGTAGPSTR